MTSLTIQSGFFSYALHHFFKWSSLKYIGLFVLTLILVSCNDPKVRTEEEYTDIATEAHASGDSRLALMELSSAIQNYPNNPEFQILRGKIFLDLEDGSSAEISFNKAISLGYNSNNIKYEIAEAWLYQRNAIKVIDHLEKEIEQGSNDPLVYEIVGRAYISSRDRTNPTLFLRNMDKAETYINEAYRLSPKNTRVLITKAWLSAMMGKLDEAIDWLEKADAIIKDQRENLAIKGELLVRLEKIDQAQEIYRRLVKKYPQYPQYKIELGYTYLLNGDFASARSWIEPVSKQYPNQVRAKYLLSNTALMEKKYDEAKKLSEEVLDASPQLLGAMIVNGASSYFLNDLENAHQKLKLFYNRTGSIPALKLLVATKLKLGENTEAAKLLANIGQTIDSQSDTELLNLVAVASAKIGKMDVALEAYQQLSKLMPDAQSFKKNAALLLISQGSYDEGFKNLEDALKEKESAGLKGQDLYTLSRVAMQTHQLDRAAIYIKQYKTVAADDYKPWIMSAVLQSDLKNHKAVREDFEKAMELAPKVAEVRSRYAIFENMQGNHNKALDLAKQAFQLNSSDIGAGKLILDDLIEQSKFDEAKTIVDNAIQNTNISDISKMLFSEYYTELGRPQETLVILNQIPEGFKNTDTYQIIAGKAYLRNGETQKAVDILETFSRKNPDNIQTLKLLLHGYLLIKNQNKYQSVLEKIDRLKPHDYTNQYDLAALYISTEKYTQAEKILAAMIPENEQQALDKEILKAGLETNRNNFKKALTILTKLVKQYPQNGSVTMLLARNLVNNGQVEEAIKVSKNWSEQNKDNLDVKLFLGDLYMHANDNDNARRQYEAILGSKIKLNPRAVLHCNNNLAVIHMASKEGDLALSYAQKAFDMSPNNPAVIDTYAQALFTQGQSEKAIKYFDQALALLPNNDRVNRSLFTLNKASALIKADQKKAAQEILKRLIKEDPGFSKIDEAKKLLSEL